jgi:hypothetical protein
LAGKRCLLFTPCQGLSQTVTRVTVVTGSRRAPGEPGNGPNGAPRGLRKGAAQERAVKAKVGAVCVLKKGRK